MINCRCKFPFSIANIVHVCSRILRVSWDKQTEQSTIDNGTLNIEIPIDQDKKIEAETELKETLDEITTENAIEKRKKRSLSSEDSGLPVIQLKVYVINNSFSHKSKENIIPILSLN